MDSKTKVILSGVDKRGRVKLPAVIIQENGLDNHNTDDKHESEKKIQEPQVNIYYGHNYSCAIIIPVSINIKNQDMIRRIEILVSEALDK